MASKSRYPLIQKKDRAVTEAIAREMNTSVDEVQKLHAEELEDLSSDAKITQYVGVLASRRVKMRLRKH